MGRCAKCMTQVPYGSLIATIMCCSGVLAFLFTLYRAVQLSLRMFEDVFTYNLDWLNNVQIIFIIVGAFMGLLSITLLVVGVFSTGATRSLVYRGWKSRVGGRISSAFCMIVVYVLTLVWLLMICCLVITVFVFYVWKHLCDEQSECVDLQQFHFMFPNGTDFKTLRICEKRKIFCTDTVYPANLYYIIALSASVLVVISLINYIMCLAANYTRIKDQEKFKDLQELQYLQDSEMGTLPKDRF